MLPCWQHDWAAQITVWFEMARLPDYDSTWASVIKLPLWFRLSESSWSCCPPVADVEYFFLGKAPACLPLVSFKDLCRYTYFLMVFKIRFLGANQKYYSKCIFKPEVRRYVFPWQPATRSSNCFRMAKMIGAKKSLWQQVCEGKVCFAWELIVNTGMHVVD